MNNFEDSSSGVGVGSIVGNKFRLEEKLGQGSFGMIFKCVNLENQEVYAMKMEKRNQRHSSMLVREIKVMMELKNEFGYARMITYGKDDDYNYVVMTNLGKNLDSILKKCGQRFSLATCMNIAEQMITRLEILHNHNLIHRDIKPENFVIGPDRSFNQIYLIDFGLAKYYKDSEGNHIPVVEKKGMIGTARYASINAHQGLEQSRRDDLEALGYVLLYFIRGKLPWQQIYAETKDEKYEKIKNMKMNYPLEQLCEGCPNELVQYLRMVKKLEFTDQPNYAALKALFKKVITDKKLESQSQNVDWENLPDYRHRKKFHATQELPPIPSQKEIALRQQQLRQQQLLLQQQQIQQQQLSKELQPQISGGNGGPAGVGETENKKVQKNMSQNNIPSVQNDKGIASKTKVGNQSITNVDNNINNNNIKQNGDKQGSSNKNNQNKASNNNNNNQQAAANEFSKQQPNSANNNISVSPPGGAQKPSSQQNVVQSPETGKFGAESRSNAIKDSEIDKQNNEKQSKNGGSTLVNMLGNNNNYNNNQQNSNTSHAQLNNREVSVSILNNHPNFQLNSSQNNSINGIQHTNNSPVNNANSSTLIGGFHPEKRNSFLHAINQVHGNSNNNLLNVPTKDQVSLSVTSITGTSKLNNYTASDSDTIVDEGGIQISTMMIDRNASPVNTSDIRKDIRTRSLVIRQSQLEIGELDMNRLQNSHSHNAKQVHSLNNFNNIMKFDSNHAAIDTQSQSKNAEQSPHYNYNTSDNTSSPKKNGKKQSSSNNQQENQNRQNASAVNGKQQSNNGYTSYRQYASAEEIKEHQDEENYSNTRNIKNYKTQFTPITEVKESTYKSIKTKTSKASFIGENITESMYEHPIMINIMPIKRAFLKKN